MYKFWHNPSTVVSHSTLIIANDQIWIGSPKLLDLSPIQQTIDRGESPLPQLGEKPVHLNEHQLIAIEAIHNDDEITFRYKKGRDNRFTSIAFVDRPSRDEAMSLLESTLRLQSAKTEYSPLRAAVGPLLFLAATIGLTYVLAMAAGEIAAGEEAEIRGRNRLIKRIFVWVASLIGPTGIWIVGAIVVLLCVVVLIRRIKDPPVITKLTPK